MRTIRELWEKLKWHWRRTRGAQASNVKLLSRLSAEEKAAFRVYFNSVQLDICYMFASHWHLPHLKKYIIWFYNSIMRERGLGTGWPVPHQCENRDKLVQLFSEMWNVPDIPEIIIHAYDLFFNKTEYHMVGAWYQGLSWTTDDILVCLTKNDIDHSLKSGASVVIPVSWKDTPTTLTVCISRDQQYTVIRVDNIERIHFIDGTYVVRLYGKDGYTHELHAADYRYSGPMLLTEIQGLDVTVRVTWRGPTREFASYVADIDLYDLSYGTRLLESSVAKKVQ